MSEHVQEFRDLQRWSDSWWPPGPGHDKFCECGNKGRGPRHHDFRCPFFGWAWEQKARDLLRGGEPAGNPSMHLRPHPREVGRELDALWIDWHVHPDRRDETVHRAYEMAHLSEAGARSLMESTTRPSERSYPK